MTAKIDYDEVGAEYLAHAEQTEEPQLRAVYLNLAAGYDSLARFNSRMWPLVEATPKPDAAED